MLYVWTCEGTHKCVQFIPPTSSPRHTTSQQTNSKVTDFAQTDCNLHYNSHKGVIREYSNPAGV